MAVGVEQGPNVCSTFGIVPLLLVLANPWVDNVPKTWVLGVRASHIPMPL